MNVTKSAALRVLFTQVVALPVSISIAASMVCVPCLTYSLLHKRGFPLREGRTGWVRYEPFEVLLICGSEMVDAMMAKRDGETGIDELAKSRGRFEPVS